MWRRFDMLAPRLVVVRLATFNIKNGLCADGTCDPDVLARACCALRADVLALQEVDRNAPRSLRADQTEVVAERCDLTPLYAPARRLPEGGEYGNALLAAGGIADVEHVPLPVAPGREARAAVLARVDVDGTSLSVAATHLQNRAPRTVREAGEQLEQLGVVLGALGRRARPRVLLGDLNMPPAIAEPVLESAGYEVADSEPTVPVRRPKLRLDYVAVDGLTLVSSEVIHTDVSDHRALVVEAA
jgi:endonuclease/exonuclease/phosphatase family metal-dependent hydrolase